MPGAAALGSLASTGQPFNPQEPCVLHPAEGVDALDVAKTAYARQNGDFANRLTPLPGASLMSAAGAMETSNWDGSGRCWDCRWKTRARPQNLHFRAWGPAASPFFRGFSMRTSRNN